MCFLLLAIVTLSSNLKKSKSLFNSFNNVWEFLSSIGNLDHSLKIVCAFFNIVSIDFVLLIFSSITSVFPS